jgi:hypothetical protein
MKRIAIINTIRNRLKSGRWGILYVLLFTLIINLSEYGMTRIRKLMRKPTWKPKLLVLDTVVFNKYANPVADALLLP